jgi:hypothetical protein
MTLLDLNLDDAKEPEVVPDGEYELQISAAPVEGVGNESGKPYIRVPMKIIGGDGLSEVEFPGGLSDICSLPHPDDDDDQRNKKLLKLQRLCKAFDIDYSGGLDLATFEGKTGWGILGTETSDQYPDKNFVKKYVAGA